MLAKTLDLDLRLRKATPSDLSPIACLVREVFTAYGSYDRYLAEWLEDENVSTRVAVLGDEIVGFYALTQHEHPEGGNRRVADLLAIAVAPAQQSRGIGESLLRSAIAEARSMACSPTEMWLFVAEGNARAQRLFAHQGFRFRRGAGIYPAGQRALVMAKGLRSTEEMEGES